MIDISQIELAGQFEISFETVGTLIVRGIKHPDLEYLISNYADIRDAKPEQFMRDLSVRLCRVKRSRESVHEKVSREVASRLRTQELDRLAIGILTNNSYILEPDEKEEDEEPPSKEGAPISRLQWLLQSYVEKHASLSKKTLEKLMPKDLFSDEVGRLVREANRFSEMLGNEVKATSALANFSPDPNHFPGALKIPENPIHETNRKLSHMDDKLDAQANLLRVMNELGNKMSFEQARSQRRFAWFNVVLISLAFLSLVLGAWFSYMDYRSSEATNEVMSELLEHLQTAAPTNYPVPDIDSKAASEDSDNVSTDPQGESDVQGPRSIEEIGETEVGESASKGLLN